MNTMELFMGRKFGTGARCYICGAEHSRDEGSPVASEIKDTATALRFAARCPSSETVCPGCATALNRLDGIEMIDGTVRDPNESPLAKQCRLYSWALKNGKRQAATKAHMHLLAKAILDLTEGDNYAISLSDDGQKHYLPHVHARVMHGDVCVHLNGKPYVETKKTVREMLAFVCELGLILSSGAIQDGPSGKSLILLSEAAPDDFGWILQKWQRFEKDPFWEIATWLAPTVAVKKELGAEQIKSFYGGIQ